MSEFRVMGILGLDGTRFAGGLKQAQAAVGRFSNSINSALTSRLAGLFAVGSIGIAIAKTVEYAGKLTDLAARTGVAVEELQKFEMAARDNGASLDDLVGFWEKLGTAREAALRNSTGGEAKAFGRLGVSRQQLQTSGAQELTNQISTAFKNTTNIEQLIAPLKEVGGKGVATLAATFQAGLDAYANMNVMTAEQADTLDELGDKWEFFKQQALVAIAPVLIQAIDAFKSLKDNMVIALAIVQGFGSAIVAGFQGVWEGLKKGEILPGSVTQNFVKAFQDQSKKAWEEIDQVTIGVQAEREDANAQEAASRAARIAARKKKPGTFSADPTGTQKIYSDALLSVGNFFGSAQSASARIQQQQLSEARRTNDKLDTVIAKLSGDKPGDDLGITA